MRPILVTLLLLLATPAVAQGPWEGWVGPLSDGIFGLRFGMDRELIHNKLVEMGLTATTSRPGTMRHEGKLKGQACEVLTEFVEDLWSGSGGRVYRIQLRWDDIQLRTSKALRFFDAFDHHFQDRYGASLASRDAGRNGLETGTGSSLRLYQGPQMQVIMEMRALRPGQIDIAITLDSPQLHPDLPGYRQP